MPGFDTDGDGVVDHRPNENGGRVLAINKASKAKECAYKILVYFQDPERTTGHISIGVGIDRRLADRGVVDVVGLYGAELGPVRELDGLATGDEGDVVDLCYALGSVPDLEAVDCIVDEVGADAETHHLVVHGVFGLDHPAAGVAQVETADLDVIGRDRDLALRPFLDKTG